MGRLFAVAEPPGVLEDLADRQIGQHSHRQHHPQDDLVRQRTAARIDPPGGRECLLNVLGWDNLFESRQAIQDPAGSSAGSVHCPCGMRVTASLLPWV